MMKQNRYILLPLITADQNIPVLLTPLPKRETGLCGNFAPKINVLLILMATASRRYRSHTFREESQNGIYPDAAKVLF